MRILLLEDDPVLSKILHKHLNATYDVTLVQDGNSALELLDNEKFELLIFDINVPGISGLDLITELRSFHDTTPIIIITAYQDTHYLKDAFVSGCNDYMRKPFELDELDARIENLSKTFNLKQAERIDLGNNISFDSLGHKIVTQDASHLIANKESEFLNYLVMHRGRVVSKDELIQNLWSYETQPSDATIRVYIRNLRALIGKERIETIRGIGYKFD